MNLNDVIIQEKDRKKQEIKQLKNMKKQEIMDKIDRLKEVTGNQSLGLSLEDLEGDFDPKKHDEIMKVKQCLIFFIFLPLGHFSLLATLTFFMKKKEKKGLQLKQITTEETKLFFLLKHKWDERDSKFGSQRLVYLNRILISNWNNNILGHICFWYNF